MTRIPFSIILIFFFFSLFTLAIGNDDKMAFSIKWKSSGKLQRGEMLNADKLYGWLKGKEKDEVKSFLGKPDQVNEFEL